MLNEFGTINKKDKACLSIHLLTKLEVQQNRRKPIRYLSVSKANSNTTKGGYNMNTVKYTDEEVKEWALDYLKDGKTIRKTASKYNVPKSTVDSAFLRRLPTIDYQLWRLVMRATGKRIRHVR